MDPDVIRFKKERNYETYDPVSVKIIVQDNKEVLAEKQFTIDSKLVDGQEDPVSFSTSFNNPFAKLLYSDIKNEVKAKADSCSLTSLYSDWHYVKTIDGKDILCCNCYDQCDCCNPLRTKSEGELDTSKASSDTTPPLPKIDTDTLQPTPTTPIIFSPKQASTRRRLKLKRCPRS
jgi:hypothetical protein